MHVQLGGGVELQAAGGTEESDLVRVLLLLLVGLIRIVAVPVDEAMWLLLLLLPVAHLADVVVASELGWEELKGERYCCT